MYRFHARDLHLVMGPAGRGTAVRFRVLIDFWTGEQLTGGREVERAVDLATLPLYVRAGAVIPTGPVRQYDGEPVEGNTVLTVYPGADGSSTLYEDDGHSFAYRTGDWMRMLMTWRDRSQRLTLRLAPGSRMRAPATRVFDVQVIGSPKTRMVTFDGETAVVLF